MPTPQVQRLRLLHFIATCMRELTYHGVSDPDALTSSTWTLCVAAVPSCQNNVDETIALIQAGAEVYTS